MLKKILIANRGEIACRIVRTAQKMGIGTVAVYSDADAQAMHVRAADEAVHIGASPATESYLVIDKIIAAAKATGADAIHPGYGFLSENPDLPDACRKAGLTFIGPTGEAMRALGGKAAAKEIAIKAGVPVVPGFQGDKQDAKSLAKEAAKVGYPVMIKAVAGGGGRGMRLVESEAQLPELLDSAKREALSAFGNGNVLLEKVVVRPRHVEVQVFGDTHGNVVHLFERDCTLQRRNQKVIEEAPAPGMSAALREKMCGAAVKLAKAVGYTGAGTVEFLVEGGSLDESAKWYFIEMNTRLQVEHPVTEEITGLDLVEWQIRVAAGERLPLAQPAIKMSGHAVEVRLCAEDPSKGFMPSVGRIHRFVPARCDDLRVETGVESGSEVSPFYDSMVSKLIVCRPTRREALSDLAEATRQTVVAGPRTNQQFLARLLDEPHVTNADMDTGLIGREIDALVRRSDSDEAVRHSVEHWLGVRAPVQHASVSPWNHADAFQLGPSRTQAVELVVDGEPRKANVEWGTGGRVKVVGGVQSAPARHSQVDVCSPQPGTVLVNIDGSQTTIERPIYDASDLDDGAATGAIRAPINGRVAKLFVALGDKVEKGDRIAVVEAMKMEHIIHAALAGTVDKLPATEGAQVNQGALLAHVAADAA